MLETLKIYWKYSQGYRLLMLLSITITIILIIVSIYMPVLYANFVDTLVLGLDHYNEVLKILYLIIILLFFDFIMSPVVWTLDSYILIKVSIKLTDICFAHIHKHSYNFFVNNFVGAITSKVNSFVRGFERVYYEFLGIIYNVLEILIILCILAYLNIFLLIASFLYIIIMLTLNIVFGRMQYKVDIDVNKEKNIVIGTFSDTISNNLNIKVFNNYQYEVHKFKNILYRLYQRYIKSIKVDAISDSTTLFINFLFTISAILIYVYLWKLNKVTIGDFVLIKSYLFVIIQNCKRLSRNIKNFHSSMSDAYEMVVIFNTPYNVVDKKDAKTLIVRDGNIVFKDVYFKYDDKYILEKFNLNIKPKESIALVGPSGVGKSTVIKLLLRLYNIQKGNIYIDGQDIANVTQESLWQNISFIPQDPILFHRSLKENIMYGKIDATEEEIIEAAKKAYIHDFIMTLEKGYDTLVGERGIKLSSGERQRISIARAILKQSPIIIFDEATSSLDSQSEHYIQKAINNLIHNKTIIIITHRLSTIKQVDRIAVMYNGSIIEEGTHDDLLSKKDSLYKNLWKYHSDKYI